MSKLVVKGTKEPIKAAITINGETHVLVNNGSCTKCSLWDLCNTYGEDEGYPCYISDVRSSMFELKEIELIND